MRRVVLSSHEQSEAIHALRFGISVCEDIHFDANCKTELRSPSNQEHYALAFCVLNLLH